MTTTKEQYVEQCCEVMYLAQQKAVASATRTLMPWREVSESGKATMRAAVSALLDFVGAWPEVAL